jgi:hypothetical protein
MSMLPEVTPPQTIPSPAMLLRAEEPIERDGYVLLPEMYKRSPDEVTEEETTEKMSDVVSPSTSKPLRDTP